MFTDEILFDLQPGIGLQALCHSKKFEVESDDV